MTLQNETLSRVNWPLK